MPLLLNPKGNWEDRLLFTHVGRWKPGTNPDDAKYKQCAVRTKRFRFINNAQLYDILEDPREQHDVASQHPEEVARLRQAYDAWWAEVRPCMENENPVNVPSQNPYKTAYWQQFGY